MPDGRAVLLVEIEELRAGLARAAAKLSAVPGRDREIAARILAVLAHAREYTSCDVYTGQPWSDEARVIYEEICHLEAELRGRTDG